MSTRTIRTFHDLEALSKAAAWELVHCTGEAVAARGQFTVSLSGGSTPKRLYQLLTSEPFRGQVDWGRVEVFWGDERCVPPDHPESNYHMAHEAMLKHLPIPPEHIHRIEAERSDRDAAARDYEAVLARVFGTSSGGEPPAFDFMLLGMGTNAHTASLFPHTQALEETRRWVVPNHVAELNTDRMTMTRPILNRSRIVLFLVAGADRAAPLAEVITGPSDPKRLPAQFIQPDGQLIWYLDDAAAARLPAPLAQENVQG